MSALLSKLHPPHFDEILCYLRDSLLAFVDQEIWPVDKLLVDLFEGFGVVVRQFYTFPHVLWSVGSFNCFDVEVKYACEAVRVLEGRDRCTRAKQYSPSFSRTVAYREFAKGQLCLLHSPVALYSFRQKFCVVVLVASNGEVQHEGHIQQMRSEYALDFVRTKLLVYDRPYYVVALHVCNTLCGKGRVGVCKTRWTSGSCRRA